MVCMHHTQDLSLLSHVETCRGRDSKTMITPRETSPSTKRLNGDPNPDIQIKNLKFYSVFGAPVYSSRSPVCLTAWIPLMQPTSSDSLSSSPVTRNPLEDQGREYLHPRDLRPELHLAFTLQLFPQLANILLKTGLGRPFTPGTSKQAHLALTYQLSPHFHLADLLLTTRLERSSCGPQHHMMHPGLAEFNAGAIEYCCRNSSEGITWWMRVLGQQTAPFLPYRLQSNTTAKHSCRLPTTPTHAG